MKQKRQQRAIRLCLLMAVTLVPTLCYSAIALSSDVVLSNEYIAITVNNRTENTGRFSIMTTGGDPDRSSDDQAHLIYRRQDQKGPWTSFSTVLIDDQAWVYGGHTRDSAGYGANYGHALQAPTLGGARQIESSWQLGPIKATQHISLVRSSTTGLSDTARICYELVNTTDQAHSVGLRIALDTLLGDNDGAPFRVGDKAITTDTVLTGGSIPEFWQAFDSLADPKVTAQGTLHGGDATVPDRVVFTNWGTLSDEPWQVNVVPGRDFTREGGFDLDSAMALVWDPVRLAPGERRTIITYVGLGGLTIAPGQLSLAITSPSTVVASDDSVFPVIAYVQNSGSGEARNVEVAIQLPTGLRLATGQPTSRPLGSLPVGATGQVRWNVVVDGGAGQLSFSVGVTAMNADPNTASRRVDIVSPAKLQVVLTEPQSRMTVVDGQWKPYPYNVKAVISNIGQAVAGGVTAEWSSLRGLRLANGDSSHRNLGVLEPGESYSVAWYVVPTGSDVGDLPYKVVAQMPSGQGVNTANGLLRVPPLESAVDFSLQRSGSQVGTYVQKDELIFIYFNARNLKSAYQIEAELTFDPTRLKLLGRQMGVDRGTLFIKETSTGTGDDVGWTKPKFWEDMSKPLARIAIKGVTTQDTSEPHSSGSIAVLRMQAQVAGVPEIRVDKLVVKDRFGQELQVLYNPTLVLKAEGWKNQ